MNVFQTYAWVQRKLGEVSNFRRGSFPQPYGLPEWYDEENGMPFVQVVDVSNNLRLVDDTKQKISERAQPKSVYVPEGRVVVTLQGSIGRVAITQYPSYVDRTLLIFEDYTTETDAYYWAYVIQQKFDIEKQTAPGGTIKTITKEVLSDFEVSLPCISEQTAIGDFFRTLDTTITLHKRKLDRLKKLKMGYLQQMFPQSGESVPKMRFDGFADVWKEQRLTDMASITMGQSPDSVNYTENPNDHILVQGNADMKNGTVVPRVWTTQVTKIANRGDLVLSVRAPVGDVGKTEYDIVLGRGVAGIKGNEFIYQTLVRMKMFGYWERIIQGSTFESINSNDLKEAMIYSPSEAEQTRIGNFFRCLDKKIASQSHKTEQLKKLKTAYLQKMFV